MKVGIRDVAKRAGVSVGTVSNVINKPEQVSAQTLARVLDVMKVLEFVPNSLAQQLRAGRGTTLGMIVLNVANPFFADLAHACESVAEGHGNTVIFGSSDQLAHREARYLDLFTGQRVAGLLVAPFNGVTPLLWRLRNRGIPLVLFDAEAPEAFCSVAMDGRLGGYLGARHLIETGRRNICFLGGPLRQVEDRWIGALRACAETSGVKLTHYDTRDTTVADGREAGSHLEKLPITERPDAVFAANDALAVGLMQFLSVSSRISVPRDLAIMGYDDIEYSSSSVVPLTSVRQPVAALAAEAIRLVLDEGLSGTSHTHEKIRLPPELVVRKSTPSTG